jgi:hypothetical protein
MIGSTKSHGDGISFINETGHSIKFAVTRLTFYLGAYELRGMLGGIQLSSGSAQARLCAIPLSYENINFLITMPQ